MRGLSWTRKVASPRQLKVGRAKRKQAFRDRGERFFLTFSTDCVLKTADFLRGGTERKHRLDARRGMGHRSAPIVRSHVTWKEVHSLQSSRDTTRHNYLYLTTNNINTRGDSAQDRFRCEQRDESQEIHSLLVCPPVAWTFRNLLMIFDPILSVSRIHAAPTSTLT